MTCQVVRCGGADDAGADDYNVFFGRGSGHRGGGVLGQEAREMFGCNDGRSTLSL